MKETLKGGYRLQSRSSVKETGLPVVSVITVVYNGSGLLEKTIKSVVAQTYPNIEYLIIDGGSSDGTLEIIRKYDQHIGFWISEPDKGIYDAMNKGLAEATGDYVWFMNAGDQIYEPDTLKNIFQNQLSTSGTESEPATLAKIYYGDTMIVDEAYREVGLRRLRPPEVLSWKSFRKGMVVCHQAILVARDTAMPFDPQYRHSADFDWVLRALKRAEETWSQEHIRHIARNVHDLKLRYLMTHQPDSHAGHPAIVNTHLVLCAFLDGGHSKQNISISLRERFHSMVRHYGLIPTVFRHIPIAARFGWYYLIHKRF